MTIPMGVEARDAWRAFSKATWLWGPGVDTLVFGGTAASALLLVVVARAAGIRELPEWGYLLFVLGIDVAHVWSTLFRTYFDHEELSKRRWLYSLLPVAVFVVGAALYRHGSLTFWRVLAYLAVFHFMRQQVGWAAIYRAKAKIFERLDRILDNTLLYLATGVPILFWHTRERSFKWFVTGDFMSGARTVHIANAILPFADGLYAIAWLAFLARFFTRRTFEWGRLLLMVTTAACWWIGIRATNSDFEFTVTNVIVHGIPYMFLLYRYGRARSDEAPKLLGSSILKGGVTAFAVSLVLIAFLEEMTWDRQVWHEHAFFFGESDTAHAAWLAFLVPLLAVPQGTHYALDAFLWRRRDVTRAQSRALGFE